MEESHQESTSSHSFPKSNYSQVLSEAHSPGNAFSLLRLN